MGGEIYIILIVIIAFVWTCGIFIISLFKKVKTLTKELDDQQNLVASFAADVESYKDDMLLEMRTNFDDDFINKLKEFDKKTLAVNENFELKSENILTKLEKESKAIFKDIIENDFARLVSKEKLDKALKEVDFNTHLDNFKKLVDIESKDYIDTIYDLKRDKTELYKKDLNKITNDHIILMEDKAQEFKEEFEAKKRGLNKTIGEVLKTVEEIPEVINKPKEDIYFCTSSIRETETKYGHVYLKHVDNDTSINGRIKNGHTNRFFEGEKYTLSYIKEFTQS